MIQAAPFHTGAILIILLVSYRQEIVTVRVPQRKGEAK
jgi:hypothetical protein